MNKGGTRRRSVSCRFRVNLCESARDYWRLELESTERATRHGMFIEKHLLKGSYKWLRPMLQEDTVVSSKPRSKNLIATRRPSRTGRHAIMSRNGTHYAVMGRRNW